MLGLTLSNCGLQGPIPDALADAFPNLEELVLSHNAGIIGHIPANLAKIYSLKVLDLGGGFSSTLLTFVFSMSEEEHACTLLPFLLLLSS